MQGALQPFMHIRLHLIHRHEQCVCSSKWVFPPMEASRLGSRQVRVGLCNRSAVCADTLRPEALAGTNGTAGSGLSLALNLSIYRVISCRTHAAIASR